VRRALLAGFAALLLAGCAGQGLATPTTGTVDAYSVAIGECTGPIPTGVTDRLELIACADEHNWEAFTATTLESEKYPGSPALTRTAGEFCEKAFADFVGVKVTKSKYDLTFLLPTDETWAAGDREVVCLAGSASKMTAGSLEGSKK
jgi:hypothetical protein